MTISITKPTVNGSNNTWGDTINDALDTIVVGVNDALDAVLPAGTAMLFVQSTAPTGWTKSTTHDDKALRIVSGTAGSGGTSSFTTMFDDRTTSSVSTGATVGATTLTEAQMPSHRHYVADGVTVAESGTVTSSNQIAMAATQSGSSYQSYVMRPSSGTADVGRSSLSGSGQSHTHSFTEAAHSHSLDMRVQYVDAIIATKD